MIPIKNIYYMLSYAFDVLKEKQYLKVATENFENVYDLYSSILVPAVSIQIKRVLAQNYQNQREALSVPRGRINISESISMMTFTSHKLVCNYDDYNENTYLNQIIKTTFYLLLKTDITKERKKAIRKLLLYFNNVDDLKDFRKINWKLNYNRNNKNYHLIISICRMVMEGWLQSKKAGKSKIMDFSDTQSMYHLYEKFILKYYMREYPKLKVSSSKIDWQTDDDYTVMLPDMKTDIMLSYNNKILIIDAKYYGHMTQCNYGKNSIHSGNLYQIFTYVKNKDYELRNQNAEVSGMLLYAKTDEEIVPDQDYLMSGNKISVKTLDLNVDFDIIKEQLDNIVKTNF